MSRNSVAAGVVTTSRVQIASRVPSGLNAHSRKSPGGSPSAGATGFFGSSDAGLASGRGRRWPRTRTTVSPRWAGSRVDAQPLAVRRDRQPLVVVPAGLRGDVLVAPRLPVVGGVEQHQLVPERVVVRVELRRVDVQRPDRMVGCDVHARPAGAGVKGLVRPGLDTSTSWPSVYV